jgi:hypothetical protein
LIVSNNTSELLATILGISEHANSSLILANLGVKFHSVLATKDPFSQGILDLTSEGMVHSKIVLLGDAAYIHTINSS